jgi:hypothetical protein
MRAHEGQFNPRSVKWNDSPHSSDAGAAAEFHFIRAGRVGDGDKVLSEAQNRRIDGMIRKTFPAGTPDYVQAILDGS